MKVLLLALLVCSIKSENGEKVNPGKLKERIVGGYNCTVEEYSHLVTILYGDVHFCGGSLIATRWVLTAEHCCVEMEADLKSFSIVVGARVLNQTVEQRSAISDIHGNKNFTRAPLSSDICVLKLKDKIQTSEKVKITKPATKQEFHELLKTDKCQKSTVMGFGDQKKKLFRSENMIYNPHVQCVTVRVVSPDGACPSKVSAMVTSTMLCADDPSLRGKDACQGDSGGPLICDDLQIGIVSGGIGCGNVDYPGFYCRVDMFSEFINGIIMEEFREQAVETSTEFSGVNRLTHVRRLIFIIIVYFFICQ